MKTKKNVVKEIDQILIAEDSPTQAEQLKYFLEKHQYKVLVAKDGKEAIGMVLEHRPSLVITDIVMPEMNGYDLCKEIKSHDKTMNIPVILLTSFSRSEDVMEGISCGADNFLTKPFERNILFQILNRSFPTGKFTKPKRLKLNWKCSLEGRNGLLLWIISKYLRCSSQRMKRQFRETMNCCKRRMI